MQCFQCDVTTNVMCDEPGEADCPNQNDQVRIETDFLGNKTGYFQCRTLRNTTTNEIVLLGCIQGTAGLGGALTFTGYDFRNSRTDDLLVILNLFFRCQASGTPGTNVTCCDTPLCNMNDGTLFLYENGSYRTSFT